MKKTLMIAAALLTLGAGAAFAGDGDVYAAPARMSPAATLQQATGQNRIFSASTQHTTSIYSSFAAPGTTEGGEN